MGKWLWPCPGNNTITSGVGPRWGSTHKGIDIAAPQGSNVVASRSGVVTKIYTTCTHNYGKSSNCGCSTYGNHIFIDHQDGYETRYAHLTDVNVRVGDRVAQGDKIGTVGSTGYSTGFHLHFEIRTGSNYLDPEEYVNSSNTINNTTPSDTPQGSTPGDSSAKTPGADTPYTLPGYTSTTSEYDMSGSVLPVMTRDFIEGKAYHAFLKIYVGNKELSYRAINHKPSIIQTFEITRLEDAGCTANFILFDDNWDEIEPYLANHWDDISMIYGYSSGYEGTSSGYGDGVIKNSRLVSPRYKMLLLNYTIDFRDNGVLLSIEAISEGIYENLKTVKLSTNTNNPVEAIKVICDEMGWELDDKEYQEALDRVSDNDLGGENYTLDADYPMTYIQNEIISESKTDDGEILTFYLDYTEDGKMVGHIKVFEYGENDSDDNMPTYVYQKGYDSVIKNLSFDIKGVFGGTTQFSTVTEMGSALFSTDTKERLSLTEKQSSVLTGATGEYTSTKSDQSDAYLPAAGESGSLMHNKIYYHVKNGANQAYEATMTILGDPKINILDSIRIINYTDYGSLHHTSGVYLVKGITDSIDNGGFMTTLKLIRNGDISNGIAMMHPKKIKGKRRS